MKYSIVITIAITIIVGAIWHHQNPAKLSQEEQAELTRIDQYLMSKRAKKAQGTPKSQMPELYAEIERTLRTPADLSAPTYGDNYLLNEYEAAKQNKKVQKNKMNITFQERGPGNVAGRTRAILVNSGDLSRRTWMAGSASGGVWVTTNAGMSWTHKSEGLPNLGSSTLASSAANPDIVYVGTGEHFTRDIDGAGMFKSEDFGETWTQIADPEEYPDFKNVSRIVVHPEDPDVIIATTRNSVWASALETAIYKTTDGGKSWTRLLSSDIDRYDDINHDPTDFNTLYVAIDGTGVIKSTDGGITWELKSEGLTPSGRIEIDVSPVDSNVIWASAQGARSGTGSDLYISTDGAETWNLLLDENANVHFLAGQGWYDNIITAHPFNANEVYVGGVDLWKFTATDKEFDNVSLSVEENGTRGFLSFVNGGRIGGGIDLFDGVSQDSVPSIEVRFGQGSQKAHRFTVDQRGPGVPAQDYTYQDYVEVPFQVWDIDNDRQLMVSFRDQQEDGVWTLKDRNVNAPHQDDSREYIFIQNIEYSDTPSVDVAQNGGHEFKQYYIIWPHRTGNSTIIDHNYPESALVMKKSISKGRRKVTKNISDAYFNHDQINTFSSENFRNNKGVHPDQHNIVTITSTSGKDFRLLVTNDGGVYLSKTAFDPGVIDDAFEYRGFGYNTTQFYSADKAPRQDRYIGGMQDNSTWYTPPGLSQVDEKTKYRFAFGGDGFEAIWHNLKSRHMLGSIQFNALQRSTNGGATWSNATNGMDDTGQGRAPFRSRLANSKLLPDRVFSVGSTGVWKSVNFAESWESRPISDSLWSYNNAIDIEVSIADYNTIWTGGALFDDGRLFVSTDGGESFNPTGYYDKIEMGSVSGIATHPLEAETGYALFSFQGRPKVLKTTDLGQTWEDISGFEDSDDGKSTRGFPDVAINSLIVFPHDPDHIWVGSEIGIIESLDGGRSWALLDTPLGPTNIHDFKQQDDQIVIATYGRGIWTAQAAEFQRDLLYPPVLSNAAITPSGKLNVDLLLNTVFDSTRIYADSQYLMTIYANRIGTKLLDIDISLLEERTYTMTAKSYKNDRSVTSNELLFVVKVPSGVITEYFNDFSDENRDQDFFGEGFSIKSEIGFEGRAIHSSHPYIDQSEAIYQLIMPVEVMPNTKLFFKEVGIIEKGEPNTTYGSTNFYDYAVVEASTDGNNWVELAPGYDARKHTEWLTAYDNQTSGNSSYIKDNLIYLEDSFSSGDTILIRFRLSSDPAANGWGWMIDDVTITQNTVVKTIDIDKTKLKIYPNPASDYLMVQLDKALQYTDATLYDLSGRAIQQWDISNDSYKELDVSSLPKGLYILSLSNNKDNTIQRIVIQ